MANKFHGGNKKKDKMLMDSYIRYLVPRVYAAIACELWEMGWTAEDIEKMFALSQERWRDSVEHGWDMLQNVQDVTGINVKFFNETGNIV